MRYTTESPPIDPSTKKKTKRRRGNHSTKVKNANPFYEVPKSHEKRPKFIQDLVARAQKRDITKSDEMYFLRVWHQKARTFYYHKVNAINALMQVFCEHVNMATFQIEISLRNASDAAGLSTTSEAEIKKGKADPNYTPVVSISRASRALKTMVDYGLIKAPQEWQVWDKEAGQWIDKYYEATPLFFQVLGYKPETIEKERNKRFGRYKKEALEAGLSVEEVGRMSIASLKEMRRQLWRKKTFERRSLEAAKKKLKKKLTSEDTREGQRPYAQQRVMESLGEELYFLTPEQYKDLVNREIAMLRKFADVPAPPT